MAKYCEADFFAWDKPLMEELKREGKYIYTMIDTGGIHYQIRKGGLANRFGYMVTDEELPLNEDGYLDDKDFENLNWKYDSSLSKTKKDMTEVIEKLKQKYTNKNNKEAYKMRGKNYVNEVVWFVNYFLEDGAAKAIEVVKNNDTVMHGVQISFNGHDNIRPVVYVEDFNLDVKIQANNIILQARESMKNLNIDNKLNFLKEFKSARKMLRVRLVNAEFNKEMLKNVPHKIVFNDLAAYLIIHINENSSTKVTNEMLKTWNKTFDELYDLALDNTERNHPCSIRTMEEVLAEMLHVPVEMIKGMNTGVPMQYILTNKDTYFGANCILYKDVLKNFANENNSDLIIIPSSIHEVIIVLKNEFDNESELNAIIKEINHGDVNKQDWLSNHYYTFKREEYYLVTITETLSKTVKVKANSLEEAAFKVELAYDKGNVILDADNFDYKEITAREVGDENLDWYKEI